jgi:protein tyrosine phosphatase (PTP) superfamily phosphohydrolase (DUF442 family)
MECNLINYMHLKGHPEQPPVHADQFNVSHDPLELLHVPVLVHVVHGGHFSTLKVGLAGTGNRTQATCLAGSVTRRSAIHYAYHGMHSDQLHAFKRASRTTS